MGEAKGKKVQENPQQGKKKVLHIGCGTGKVHKFFQTPEWQEVRVDIDPGVKPDIVANMLDMKMIANNEVDAIFSSHNLEHLYPHEVPIALNEFYRILKEGGMLLITMPDIQRVAEEIAQGKLEKPLYTSPSGPISAIDILYGHRAAMAKGHIYMAHKNGFSAVTLANKLIMAKFTNIVIERETYNLWAKAFKIANFDKSKNTPKIIEPDPNRMIEGRDNIKKEPEIWTPLGLRKK